MRFVSKPHVANSYALSVDASQILGVVPVTFLNTVLNDEALRNPQFLAISLCLAERCESIYSFA